jgi:hypothetical protein
LVIEIRRAIASEHPAGDRHLEEAEGGAEVGTAVVIRHP